MIDCPWAGGKEHDQGRRTAVADGISGDSAEIKKLRTDRLNFIKQVKKDVRPMPIGRLGNFGLPRGPCHALIFQSVGPDGPKAEFEKASECLILKRV
jgi:hypothetical protein